VKEGWRLEHAGGGTMLAYKRRNGQTVVVSEDCVGLYKGEGDVLDLVFYSEDYLIKIVYWEDFDSDATFSQEEKEEIEEVYRGVFKR